MFYLRCTLKFSSMIRASSRNVVRSSSHNVAMAVVEQPSVRCTRKMQASNNRNVRYILPLFSGAHDLHADPQRLNAA